MRATVPPSPSSLAPAALAAGEGAARSPKAAGKPSLGNNGVSSVTDRAQRVTARRQRRDEAYRWRSRLWEWSSLPRLRKCGRHTHGGSGGPMLRGVVTAEGRHGGVAGLQSCASPWACPICSKRIARSRARDVRQVGEAVAAAGGSAAMVTLTMRHRPGQPLAELWEALSHAWGCVTSGARWKADKALLDVLGWARTVEATHGENGWHLHIHAVIFFETPVSRELMDYLAMRMFARWERGLVRHGLSAVADKGGLDVRQVRMGGDSIEVIAEYLTKIAAEITSPSTKDGRFGNRAPFAILRDALETGLYEDCALWLEWEQASQGRKQLTWSRGLREWAKVGREKTDDEIVDEDLHGEDVFLIAPESWPGVRERLPELLDAYEELGPVGAKAWMTVNGFEWLDPKPRRHE